MSSSKYAELHRFETAFERDPYVQVGADGSDPLMAQGAATLMYGRQHLLCDRGGRRSRCRGVDVIS